MGNRDEARAHYRAYVNGGPPGARRDEAAAWLASGESASTASGGVDALALGLTLGVGLVVAGTFAALAGAWWVMAEDEYARLENDCGDMCSDGQLSTVEEQLLLTNAFLITSVAAAGLTALGAVLVVALPGGDEQVAVGPGSIRVRF